VLTVYPYFKSDNIVRTTELVGALRITWGVHLFMVSLKPAH